MEHAYGNAKRRSERGQTAGLLGVVFKGALYSYRHFAELCTAVCAPRPR